MELKHEAEYICEYICVCEKWDEPVLYPVAELIRCRECKHALPQGEYGDWFICDVWDHQIHTLLNGYCYKAEKKEPNTHER